MSREPSSNFRNIRNLFRDQSRQTRNRRRYTNIPNDPDMVNDNIFYDTEFADEELPGVVAENAALPLGRATGTIYSRPAFRGASPAVTTREIRQNRDGSQTAIEIVNSGNLKESNAAMKRHYQNAADARKTMERVQMRRINADTDLARRQMQYEYANQRDERQHDINMKSIDHSTELTDNRIKLRRAETDIAQNWIQFKDNRALMTQQFINAEKANHGIRTERKLVELFDKFDMIKPSRLDYQTPLESDYVVLPEKMRHNSYVYSKLYHGVSKINYTDTRREIYFYNGKSIKFPRNVVLMQPLPYVVIVHVFSRNIDAIEEDHEQDCPCSECRVY